MAGVVRTGGAKVKPTKGKLLDVIAKTANATLTADESGSVITNEGALGAVYLTLPTAAPGLWYIIFAAANQELYVLGDTADNMVVFNDVAADNIAINVANEIAGGGLLVVSDGTKWYAMEMTHDAQTFSIGT